MAAMERSGRILRVALGLAFVALAASAALSGLERSTSPGYWAYRANGSIWFAHFGLASVMALAWVLLQLLTGSHWLWRYELAHPGKGNVIRRCANTVAALLVLFIVLLIVLMPVA
jgi:hypothetical protein